MNKLIEQLKRHEGVKLMPYHDTVGKLTIGIGRNIADIGITADEAEMMLKNDLTRCEKELQSFLGCYYELDQVRREVMLNMCFNLGRSGLFKFKRFLAAVNDGFFELAAKEMLDSKWAKQVGSRAIELSEQMRTGEYQ